MKKLLAFAGSNSKTSINKQLVTYTSSLVEDAEITLLDLNDFPLPVFGVDLQEEQGIPDNAKRFLEYIKASDGIFLSLAEHNGAYSTVFKNLFDWMSRIEGELWQHKPMLLMATSPGARGGASVLDMAKTRFPFNGGNVVASFSLPKFKEHFSSGRITDEALRQSLENAVAIFKDAL
ncbi:NADPH-dependent FMN reductase [Formosa sp. S-31]|uniref:NADPH-dependent FMN reductase n=1 Tax=Formosa sp. S-31 TaxID=2790949 RepID=UPI003EBC6607